MRIRRIRGMGSLIRGALVLFLLVMWGGSGCKNEILEEPYSQQDRDAFVATWSEQLPETLLEQGSGGSPSKLLEQQLQKALGKQAKVLPSKPGDPMRIPPYAQLAHEVYEGRKFKLGLVGSAGLTDAGVAALTRLQGADAEGYEPGTFAIDDIEKDLEELKALGKSNTEEELKPIAEEVAWASSKLEGVKPSEKPLDEAAIAEWNEAFLKEKGGRVKEVLKASEETAEQVAKLRASIEERLVTRYMDYAFLERYKHVRSIFVHPREDDYYNDPEIKKTRPDKAKGPYQAGLVWRRATALAESIRNDNEIAQRRIVAHVQELMESDSPSAVAQGLEPQLKVYQGLVKEHIRYQGIVEKGGWEVVTGNNGVRPGANGPTVLALKKRLAAEGYKVSTENSSYDKELEEAVLAYQQTHQLPEVKVPNAGFWASLNVPAERRLELIALNLRRFRWTNMRPERDDIFVFINVPDFMLELWEKGKRLMRFAVVVGNNQSEIDEESPKRERIWKNRSPVPLAAYIDRVIFNPYWNVTPRIREEEILPQVKKYVEKQYNGLKERYLKAAGLAPIDPSPAPAAAGAGEGAGGVADATGSATGGGAPAPPPVVQGSLDSPQALVLKAALDAYPYWNAETQEIDVSKTLKDHIPGWYAANNYEVVHMGPDWEYVRMTQGPHNALGQLKVIFPNYFDVYLHDTPAKSKFKATTRAFSHGCVRMEDPLGFAKTLLEREGKYESHKVPEILSSRRYEPIFFDRKIPVFMEYYTVVVDDQGRARFLSDPYHFDRDGIEQLKLPPNRHLDP